MTTEINGVPRKLKPCPFCGGSAESRLYDCQYFVQCIECFNSTAADHQAEEDAVAAWNKRATAQPAADGEREAFEAWMREEYAADDDMLKKPYEGRYFYGKPANMWDAWQARAAQPQQAVAVTDEVNPDTSRLDFLESHPNWLRAHKGRWSCKVPFTNYSYPVFKTAREAIDAALSAHKTGEEE